MQALITGGAGFIGSHLADALIARGDSVVCVDDLSLGTDENIKHLGSNPRFRFEQLDVNNIERMGQILAKERIETVFHLAANSDILKGSKTPTIDLERTFTTTFSTLEAMRQAGTKNMVFASSSTVYGERLGKLAEDSGPLLPTSLYGAAKLASEAYIAAYCENFGMKAWINRFPNVVGDRSTHGVIFDFLNKLERNPRQLEILGNGEQCKPYLYVKDLVDGLLFTFQNAIEKINVYNLAPEDGIKVRRIAEILVEELGFPNVKFKFTGGDRGWVGDVPRFEYDLTKVHRLGWKAQRSSEEAIRHAVKMLIEERAAKPQGSE